MRLRKLKASDAEPMLEWMHDHELVKDLHRNFEKLTIEDCKAFIQKANESKEDRHYAVTDDNDIYLGTVSLKDIDKELKCAELGIVMRRCSHGTGAAQYAVKEVIDNIGHNDCGLETVYWCVSGQNIRALRFYDKMGFARIDIFSNPKISEHINKTNQYSCAEIERYIWYVG